jgi:hypothetical protein
MKKFLFILFFVPFSFLTAQNNTNVYLLDIVKDNDKVSFENLRIVSNRNYYDNQPSFYDDNTVLFVATRNGQTDIAKYDIKEDIPAWVTNTPGGSEYSPIRVPNSDDISAIRLDTNGLQRLYRYDSETNEPVLLIDKIKVGYQIWDNEDQLVTSVLVKNGMNLMLNYIPDARNNTVDRNVGRSLHKIPNSELISFITAQNGANKLSSYDSSTGKIEDLMAMPLNAQDMCWLDEKSVLVPNGKRIMLGSVGVIKPLKVLHEFKEKEIYNISRMAISPNGKHLALVADENPEIMVDKQVENFNAGDLNGFVSCFSDTVTVCNYPNTILYKGRAELKKNYGRHMDENLSTNVKLVNRIVMRNFLIDEEIIKENGEEYHQSVVYEVVHGAINSMTFVHETKKDSTVEKIVDEQLVAYRARNLNLFAKSYAEDVEIYDFPNTLISKGKDALKESYAGFFERAIELDCEIKNRMIVGNVVIDEEVIRTGSNSYRAIAMYEIENGLIQKVTFIR